MDAAPCSLLHPCHILLHLLTMNNDKTPINIVASCCSGSNAWHLTRALHLYQMWGRLGQVDQAQGVFDSMPPAIRHTSVAAATAMVVALAELGKVSEARAMVAKMLQTGPAPTVHTYTALVSWGGRHCTWCMRVHRIGNIGFAASRGWLCACLSGLLDLIHQLLVVVMHPIACMFTQFGAPFSPKHLFDCCSSDVV